MMKKLTIITPSLLGGGQELMLNSLVENFKNNNWKLDIVVVYPNKKSFFNKNVNVINFNKKKIIYSLFDLFFYFKRNKPDVIFSLFHTTSAIVKVFRFFLRYKTLLIFHFCNNVSAQFISNYNNKQRYKIIDKFCHKLIITGNNNNTIFLTVSKGIAENLKNYWKVKNEIFTIYNPIDLKKINSTILEKKHSEKLQLLGDNFIISIGRLTFQKNFELLIRSFNAIKDKIKSNLVIIGEGEENDYLKTICCELNIDHRVIFLGFVEDPFYLLFKSKLFVLTSRFEGLGNVIIEALACNVNVISCDCDYGPREILDNGKWGELFNQNDINKLPELLLKNLNKEKLENYKEIVSFYDVNKITSQYIDLFENKL